MFFHYIYILRKSYGICLCGTGLFHSIQIFLDWHIFNDIILFFSDPDWNVYKFSILFFGLYFAFKQVSCEFCHYKFWLLSLQQFVLWHLYYCSFYLGMLWILRLFSFSHDLGDCCFCSCEEYYCKWLGHMGNVLNLYAAFGDKSLKHHKFWWFHKYENSFYLFAVF